jgi:hypothetical protein
MCQHSYSYALSRQYILDLGDRVDEHLGFVRPVSVLMNAVYPTHPNGCGCLGMDASTGVIFESDHRSCGHGIVSVSWGY